LFGTRIFALIPINGVGEREPFCEHNILIILATNNGVIETIGPKSATINGRIAFLTKTVINTRTNPNPRVSIIPDWSPTKNSVGRDWTITYWSTTLT